MSRGASRATSASAFRTVSREPSCAEQSPSDLHDSVDRSMPLVERTLYGPWMRNRGPLRSSSSATDAAGAHLAASSPNADASETTSSPACRAARSAINATESRHHGGVQPMMTRTHGGDRRTNPLDLRRSQRIGNRRDTRLVHHLSIGADGARGVRQRTRVRPGDDRASARGSRRARDHRARRARHRSAQIPPQKAPPPCPRATRTRPSLQRAFAPPRWPGLLWRQGKGSIHPSAATSPSMMGMMSVLVVPMSTSSASGRDCATMRAVAPQFRAAATRSGALRASATVRNPPSAA